MSLLKLHKETQAIVFDFDGTIALSEPVHIKAWIDTIIHHSKSIPENFEHHILGQSDQYIAGMLCEYWQESLPKDALIAKKMSLFKENIRSSCPLVEGVLEAIKSLASHTPLALATSSSIQEISPIIEHYELTKYFKIILTIEDVVDPKPNPEIYLKAAELLGVSPENCWVFEDSTYGITAANRAGMKVVGITTSLSQQEMPPVETSLENFENFAFIESFLGLA